MTRPLTIGERQKLRTAEQRQASRAKGTETRRKNKLALAQPEKASRSPAEKPSCAVLLVCLRCDGLGEWDELQPARSRVQESPDYKKIECPDCGGTGRLKAGRT